jgi:hypothetical protein
MQACIFMSLDYVVGVIVNPTVLAIVVVWSHSKYSAIRWFAYLTEGLNARGAPEEGQY